jgi:flagellar motor component MotA
MPEDLTDTQIALLCTIGEFDPLKQTEEKKRDVARLLSAGFVESSNGDPPYKLTAKGNKFLGDRGATLNEA